MLDRDIDIPNLPFEKPSQIEKLEKMSFEQREAMDRVELDEHLQDAADSLAASYRKSSEEKKDYEGCVIILTAALEEIGGSFGGKMGAYVVGSSNKLARRSCREAFTDETDY